MPINVRDRAGDNYNRGQKVRIKLRRLDGSFEEYEHVLMVMLHELCHNEFGACREFQRQASKNHFWFPTHHFAWRRV